MSDDISVFTSTTFVKFRACGATEGGGAAQVPTEDRPTDSVGILGLATSVGI